MANYLPDRIPVFLLSGFLGAGKSTLLNDLLADPAFHDTAVVINEFGEIPIDHLLVRHGDISVSRVSAGCFCCAGSSDLRVTLFDLHCAASAGLAPPFSRVIVEMSGLGDPAPLVNALSVGREEAQTLRNRTIGNAFHLAGFVTLYDIVTGETSNDRHLEAVKQIAFADRIVLTKTDLAKDPATKADIAALPGELRMLNPGAVIVDRQDATLGELFSPRPYLVVERGEDVAAWLALEDFIATRQPDHAPAKAGPGTVSRHTKGIRTFSITRDAPVPTKRFFQFLAVLQNSAGPGLLRVKGIVGLAEEPDFPRIVHVVQHSSFGPVRLDAWPDGDRRTRLVFITNGIDPEPVHSLFSAVIDGRSSAFGSLLARLGGSLDAPASLFASQLSNILRRVS